MTSLLYRRIGSSPRLWGTLVIELSSICIVAGSSPRLWGTLLGRHADTSCMYGSSPRLWGTPSCMALSTVSLAVHPHACGEHCKADCDRSRSRSVHPHACGEHAVHLPAIILAMRFIPTPVGNTHRIADSIALSCGSSPRLWGTPAMPFAHCSIDRFIPTPVGNTSECVHISIWYIRFIPTPVGNTQPLFRQLPVS